MNSSVDYEAWLLDAGDVVIRKMARAPETPLSSVDRLVYCLWVADCSMRNAGDLATAADIHAKFQEEGAGLAAAIGLAVTKEAFALSAGSVEQCYFDRFDSLCAEVSSVWSSGPSA